VMLITVIAADAVDAEVLATSLFLAGMNAAAAAADAAGVPVVLVGEDGRTLLAGGLA
jgi:thiamine biosynthesis lipoprotein ApbE